MREFTIGTGPRAFRFDVDDRGWIRSQAMPDGTVPEPGGWNRFSLEVSDIEATVERLRKAGARFRNEILTGVGGKQILVEDHIAREARERQKP